MNQAASTRSCPLCGGEAGTPAFPYRTVFNQIEFRYLACRNCSTIFVAPVPDAATFGKMYAKAAYHDRHYGDVSRAEYDSSAHLLAKHVPAAARVLDYGCGVGDFMVALSAAGLSPEGVEFDADAAALAARRANCAVRSVDEFVANPRSRLFDAIHFGDVLEHLPDPAATLNTVLPCLKAGGVLFAEGPLENNPSAVMWAARTFGWAKRRLKPRAHGVHPPTHLFRCGSHQQKHFFSRAFPRLKCIHWEVYETGFPYSKGGWIKRLIAGAALVLGGRKLGRATFGNRFRALFIDLGRAESRTDATAEQLVPELR